MLRMFRSASAALVIFGIVAGVELSTASASSAAGGSLTIVSAKPNPSNLVIGSVPGSASENVVIKWKGEAKFPITANLTPLATCSQGNFTCNPASVTFKKGGYKLKWVGGMSCSIDAGTPPGSFSGGYLLTLTDAKGRTSPPLSYTFSCSWN